MIVLTRMNKEKFLLNHNQIEYIECIPETRIVMANHDFYLVEETVEQIIAEIREYNAKVLDVYRQVTVTDKRK